ncbi:hypothetical protein EI555_010178 [Monodon monoceros]|uniref:Acyltransferase C-terminal domain-containing protein n=1 Tax=Monodon monoceros TaxID=40151 RepID=A0A4U1ECK2_MONMO|nr:hypothetical protein EI555_010178 [Monodon monoceros]
MEIFPPIRKQHLDAELNQDMTPDVMPEVGKNDCVSGTKRMRSDINLIDAYKQLRGGNGDQHVDHLREGKNLDAVHDITVAYPHNIPQTERHVLLKDLSKEIHFHVHRYPVDTLPTSKEDLQLWYHKWWEEKEERLCCFSWGEKTFYFMGQTVIPPCKSVPRILLV